MSYARVCALALLLYARICVLKLRYAIADRRFTYASISF